MPRRPDFLFMRSFISPAVRPSCSITNGRWPVDGPAARAHHKAVERREAHGGVHRHTMSMADIEQPLPRWHVMSLRSSIGSSSTAARARRCSGARCRGRRTCGWRTSRTARRARGTCKLRRQRLEKRRIEHGNHRRARHVLEARVDAHERRLVVQRRELRQLVDLLDDVVVDKHRAIEVLASLHDAMAYRIDFLERVDAFVGPLVSDSRTSAIASS